MLSRFDWMKEWIMLIFQQTRYVILGIMDGTLTVLGVVAAGYFAGLTPYETFRLALGAGIGITAASFTGAYFAEQAEHSKERLVVEKAMGVKQGYLKKTVFKLHQERHMLLRALADSSFAFLGTLVAALPLLVFPAPLSFLISISFALALLFGVGAYLGRLNRSSIIKGGLRALVVSFFVLAINLLFGRG